MKSKFTFIIIIFSLFFNISHDIIIANEIESCNCTSTLQLVEESYSNCYQNILSELHEVFHFSAILVTLHLEFPPPLPTKLFFVASTPPTTIYQTTFKPPIV